MTAELQRFWVAYVIEVSREVEVMAYDREHAQDLVEAWRDEREPAMDSPGHVDFHTDTEVSCGFDYVEAVMTEAEWEEEQDRLLGEIS